MQAWKVKRELRRVAQQISLPLDIALSPIIRFFYDRAKARCLAFTAGRTALQDRIAVYVIYRPAGLLASHLETISFLANEGYAVLAVVNHPLTPADMDRLKTVCWSVLIRPNIGYDFGGYRDAILHLLDRHIAMERLLVMNDSVWFPIGLGSTVLQDMARQSDDLTGYVMDRHKRSNKPPFVQSFCFMFGPAILRSNAFRLWWQSMLITDNKWLVIRRLEMGMSPYFSALGFSVGALFEFEKLPRILAALPLERQLLFLEFEKERLGPLSDTLMRKLTNSVPISDGEWEQAVRDSQVDGHILKLPPALLFEVFDVPMLKKLKVGHFKAQRQALIARGDHLRFSSTVRDEICHWDDEAGSLALHTRSKSEPQSSCAGHLP